MPFISLLTDFGLQDPYVGIMKGVIHTLSPQAQLIDLSHGIPPQDVAAARFALMTAYPYLPSGTIHLAVVDPGVGSSRRAVAIQTETGFLVGPDNGLFSGVLAQTPALAAVELNRPRYWRTPSPSRTFHGRDIFAPTAAHLGQRDPFGGAGGSPRRSRTNPLGVAATPDGDQRLSRPGPGHRPLRQRHHQPARTVGGRSKLERLDQRDPRPLRGHLC